jgi:hypothetical protein
MFSVFAGAERMNFYALFVALACVIALAILWGSRLRLGYHRAGVEAPV